MLILMEINAVEVFMSDAIITFFQERIANDFLSVILLAILPIIELRGAIPIGVSLGYNPWQALLIAFIGSSIPVAFLLLLLKPVLNIMKKIKIFNGIAVAVEDMFNEKAQEIAHSADKDNKKNKKQDKNNIINGVTINTVNGHTTANKDNKNNQYNLGKSNTVNASTINIVNQGTTTNNNQYNNLDKSKDSVSTASNIENHNTTDGDSTVTKKAIKADRDLSLKYKLLGVFLFVAIPIPLTGVWTGSAVATFLNIDFKKAFLIILLGNLCAGLLVTLVSIFFIDYLNIIIGIIAIIFLLLLTLFIYKVAVRMWKNSKSNKTL